MRPVNTANDIRNLGSILSIWAHPDDETFSCGGILAAAVGNGQPVACVTFTKGEAGSQDENRWPSRTLGEVRAKEFYKAMEILGCAEHNLLSFADGGLEKADRPSAVRLVKNFIDQYEPDTILTFGPEGLTGHPDHQTVSSWVSEAVDDLSDRPEVYHAVELRSSYDQYFKNLDEQFDIFFNIDRPPLKSESECDICITLPAALCRKKCAALAAMPSQTEKLMAAIGDDAEKVFCKEAFVIAK